jgi:hypothetical protein
MTTPSPSTSVVIKDCRNGYGRGYGYDNHSSAEHLSLADQHLTLSNSLHTTARLNGDAIGSSGRDTLLAIGSASRDCLKATCDSTHELSTQLCDSTASVIAANERIGISIKDQVDRNGSVNLQSTERNSGEIRLGVERTAAETRQLVNTNTSNIQMMLKDFALSNCEDHKDLSRQAADNAACIKLELCKTENALSKQAAENMANIRLDAFKHKEALSAQLADCCCELKEKVDERTSEIKQVLADNETQRLRDELADCKNAQTTGLLNQLIAGLLGTGAPAAVAALSASLKR